ncbi:MAG: arabinofuranosidase catalytic domain-containing protein [Polyangiaceae bacterium]
MKVIYAALATATAFSMFSGCGNSSTPQGAVGGSSSVAGAQSVPGNAGATNTTAGASSGGGSATCSNVAACGGMLVGTYTATTSCLAVSGMLDMSNFGLGCKSAPITGSLNVTGTFTANADGSYVDNTMTTGTATIEMGPACLNVSNTTTTCDRVSSPFPAQGLNGTCVDSASGGCTCSVTVQQTGSIGLPVATPSTTGNFSTAANVLTLDETTKYSYCVAGDKLNIAAQGAVLGTTTGSIELQNGSGGSGAGGAGPTAGAGGAAPTAGAGGAAPTGGSGPTGQGPCDIYAAASTPCVAAYSMGRVLLSKYAGPLYQVRKGGQKTGTGGTTQDILAKGGFADSASQDTFCGTDTCTVSKLYDQSGKANDLIVAPAGCYNDGSANTPDYESNAKGRSLTVGGHKVYALKTIAHDGYRNNKTTGMPMGATEQGIYMIMDGKNYGTACCWDFGNAAPDNCNGSIMNTLYFGTGYWGKGASPGPWFLGDFEGGVWAGGSGASTATNPSNPSMGVDYAFGLLKTSVGKYAIKAANAQSGALTVAYDGASPKQWNNKGAIVMGIGGDNSNHSPGTFFEGAITTGRPSDATDAAVLKNVQDAGYGK